MLNPISLIIEAVVYIINVLIILKSTGKTKALGIAFLLYRLTLLLYFFTLLLNIYFPTTYFIVGLGVIALLLFFIKRSLVSRNYAILIGAFMLFGKIVTLIGFALLLIDFYNEGLKAKKLKAEINER